MIKVTLHFDQGADENKATTLNEEVARIRYQTWLQQILEHARVNKQLDVLTEVIGVAAAIAVGVTAADEAARQQRLFALSVLSKRVLQHVTTKRRQNVYVARFELDEEGAGH